jgi:uncharacterized protein RhaS with RHS repeats
VSTTFGYDGPGRLQSRVDTITGRGYTTTIAYDGNDNLKKLIYASGRIVEYDLDSENRILTVGETNNAGSRIIADNFSYHPSGAITRFISGNRIENTISYDDKRYWVRSIQAGLLMSLGYDYQNDHVGNVKSITDSRAAGLTQSFDYDVLDRLTNVSVPNWGSANYTYDAHGNRIGGSLGYFSGKLQLQSQNGVSFSYDPNGNMNGSSGATYTYTLDNQLSHSTASNVSSDYLYDADGWRAKMVLTPGATSYFLRGPRGELLSEMRNPGAASPSMRDYVYSGSRLLAVIIVPDQAR